MCYHLLTLDCFLDMKSNHLTRPVTPPSSIGPWRPPYRDRLLSTSCRRTPLVLEQHARGRTIPCTKSQTHFKSLSRDATRHGENGQVQGDEDPPDQAANHDHENGVDGVGEVLRRRVDLRLVERRDFPQHGLQGTRLLADRRHLDDHWGEELCFGHGCTECGAALDGADDPVDGRRNDGVAHRAAHHLQTSDERDAGAEQGGQCVGETGHRGLEHQGADDRRLERQVVLPMDAVSYTHLTLPTIYSV